MYINNIHWGVQAWWNISVITHTKSAFCYVTQLHTGFNCTINPIAHLQKLNVGVPSVIGLHLWSDILCVFFCSLYVWNFYNMVFELKQGKWNCVYLSDTHYHSEIFNESSEERSCFNFNRLTFRLNLFEGSNGHMP